MAVRHADFVWLPDDTEESVVGTQLHQKAFLILCDTLWHWRDERGETWGAACQLRIEGFTRRDGSAYAPMPDLLLHPRFIPEDIATITLDEYGPPWFVLEVASPSTVMADLGEKAATYFRGGVREYIVFDTTGDMIPSPCIWARRLDAGRVVPWEPEADGRWHSAFAGLSFAPDGAFLRAYDEQGNPIPTLPDIARLHRREEQRRIAAEERQRVAEDRQRVAEERVAALEAELRRLSGEGAGD